MSRLVSDLEAALGGLVAEHRKLLEQVRAHEAALRAFDLKGMEMAAAQQEATRLRITTWENRRRAVVSQLAKALRLEPNVTLARLAALHPLRRDALLNLRDELKGLAEQIAGRTKVSGRIAAAVLGHLNTAVRLLAGAVEKAGVYTKQGVPQVTRRIGVMEAVG
jgi:hypothetical protein